MTKNVSEPGTIEDTCSVSACGCAVLGILPGVRLSPCLTPSAVWSFKGSAVLLADILPGKLIL